MCGWSAPSSRMAERVAVVVLARPRVEHESERVDAAVAVDVGTIGEKEHLERRAQHGHPRVLKAGQRLAPQAELLEVHVEVRRRVRKKLARDHCGRNWDPDAHISRCETSLRSGRHIVQP